MGTGVQLRCPTCPPFQIFKQKPIKKIAHCLLKIKNAQELSAYIMAKGRAEGEPWSQ